MSMSGSQIVQSFCEVRETFSQILALCQTQAEESRKMQELGARLTDEVSKIAKSNEEIEVRLGKLENNGVQSVSDASTKHFVLTYLMRVGMDTSIGYSCACPVLFKGDLYVAISLNLLSTSYSKFIGAQTGMTMKNFQKVFKSVHNPHKIIAAARKILAHSDSNPVNAAEVKRWVVLRAEDFVEMCKTTEEKGEEEWEGVNTVKASSNTPASERGYKFPKMIMAYYGEEDDDQPGSKMRWGVRASQETLELDCMMEYRDLVATTWKINLQNPSAASDFTAHDVFSPRTPRGQKMPPVYRKHGTKGVNFNSPTAAASRESDNSDSSSDSSEDEDSSDSEGGEVSGKTSRKRLRHPTVDVVDAIDANPDDSDLRKFKKAKLNE